MHERVWDHALPRLTMIATGLPVVRQGQYTCALPAALGRDIILVFS